MLKKQINITKGVHTLMDYPMILLFHFNNVTMKNWQQLKKEINKINGIQTLVVNTKLSDKVRIHFSLLEKKGQEKKENLCFFLEKKSISTPIEKLLQGPTLLLCCKTHNQLVSIISVFKNSSHFIFVGGFYNNQYLAHTTLEKILTLSDSTKTEPFHFLEKEKSSMITLINSVNLEYFFLIKALGHTLECDHQKQKLENSE